MILESVSYNIYKYGVSPIKLPEYIKSGSKIVHVTNSENSFFAYDNYKIVNTNNINKINKHINDFLLKKKENNYDNRLIKKLNYDEITRNLLKFIMDNNKIPKISK